MTRSDMLERMFATQRELDKLRSELAQFYLGIIRGKTTVTNPMYREMRSRYADLEMDVNLLAELTK